MDVLGNRGKCAQTCRLPYELIEENQNKLTSKLDKGYLLSTRDLCSLEYLPMLIDAGVTSFKIEGRMKSPEYVATVTKIYRKYIDSLLESDGQSDWKYIKQEHLTQLAFFQHERLVHLIVTVTFAVLELLTVCACVIVGALDSTFSFPLLILALLILVLLIPYIKHYYLLENEVQKMYVQYDRIVQKMYEEEKNVRCQSY